MVQKEKVLKQEENEELQEEEEEKEEGRGKGGGGCQITHGWDGWDSAHSDTVPSSVKGHHPRYQQLLSGTDGVFDFYLTFSETKPAM